MYTNWFALYNFYKGTLFFLLLFVFAIFFSRLVFDYAVYFQIFVFGDLCIFYNLGLIRNNIANIYFILYETLFFFLR